MTSPKVMILIGVDPEERSGGIHNRQESRICGNCAGARSGPGLSSGSSTRMPTPPRPATARVDGSRHRSPEHFADDPAMHVGEPPVDAIMAEGEPLVIDAQEVEDRGVEVIAVEQYLTEKSK